MEGNHKEIPNSSEEFSTLRLSNVFCFVMLFFSQSKLDLTKFVELLSHIAPEIMKKYKGSPYVPMKDYV